MKKKNIILIFDFDGVLVDTIKVMNIAWTEVRNKLKVRNKFSQYKKLIGFPFSLILNKMKIFNNHKKIYKVYHHTSLKNEKYIKTYKGVRRTLIYLKNKGYKVAIVTSKNKSRVIRLVKKFKLPITNINCPHKNFKGKPFPDQIFRAIKKTKIVPSKIFYIGDMYVDYLTAKNSKINFIFAKYGYEKRTKSYKNTINAFPNLPKVLARISE